MYELKDVMNTIIHGNTPDILKELPDKSINCCVTSPPYYGLRDYDLPATYWPAVTFKPMTVYDYEVTVPEWEGCLGLEPSPVMYVAHLVLIFREVYRVLRDDGTLWLNLGDSYAGSSMRGGNNSINKRGGVSGHMQSRQFDKPVQCLGAETQRSYGATLASSICTTGRWVVLKDG